MFSWKINFFLIIYKMETYFFLKHYRKTCSWKKSLLNSFKILSRNTRCWFILHMSTIFTFKVKIFDGKVSSCFNYHLQGKIIIIYIIWKYITQRSNIRQISLEEETDQKNILVDVFVSWVSSMRSDRHKSGWNKSGILLL